MKKDLVICIPRLFATCKRSHCFGTNRHNIKKHKKYTVKGQSSTLREGTADGNRKERDYGDIADTSISNNRTTNHSPNAHLP